MERCSTGFGDCARPRIGNYRSRPHIESEYRINGRKIDILIEDLDEQFALGIEVKTASASAEPGQLEAYYEGLKEKDFSDVAMTYLTPFNRERAGKFADKLLTVQVFDDFTKNYPTVHVRHVSWLDVAKIDWEGNELWRQHQRYVRHEMASLADLKSTALRDRSLDEFFGSVIEGFWERLREVTGLALDSRPVVLDLEDLKGRDVHPERLATAFEILIKDAEETWHVSKKDDFDENAAKKFRESMYEEYHTALFNLSRYDHAWIQGQNDYGLRVAHRRHRQGGVSLARSRGEQYLVIGQKR